MVKAGLDRLQFCPKSHRTVFHLPEKWPHVGQAQRFQKLADPGAGVAVKREKFAVSTGVTLLGGWGFVAPANGAAFACLFEFFMVITELIDGSFDFPHHAT